VTGIEPSSMWVQLLGARSAPVSEPARTPVATTVPRLPAAARASHRLACIASVPADAPLQRQVYSSGAGTYTSENFRAGTRERPKDATAEISTTRTGVARGRTPTALATLHNPGQPAGAADKLLGFDGGHVVGLQPRGVDEYYNVVPMYPGFNRGVFKNVEDRIALEKLGSYVGLGRIGPPFRVVIELRYVDDNEMVPHAISVKTEKNVGGAWVLATDYGTLRQPADIAVTASPSTSEKGLLLGTRQRDRALADAGGLVFDEDRYELAMRTAIRAIFPGGSAVDAAIDLPLIDAALGELWSTGEPSAETLADHLDVLRARFPVVDALRRGALHGRTRARSTERI
jgi:hypothetical protein